MIEGVETTIPLFQRLLQIEQRPGLCRLQHALRALDALNGGRADARGRPGGYDPVVRGLGANGYGPDSPAGYQLASCFVVEVLGRSLVPS